MAREYTSFKYQLGEEAKDTITGFKGIIISRAQWLYGCNTYGIKTKKLSNGKPEEAIFFDEDQIVIIKKKKKTTKKIKNPGGPIQTINQNNRF